MKEAFLPDWASSAKPGVIEVEASKFYPEFFGELELDQKEYDQYWLEVVKTMMKWDIMVMVSGTELAPKAGGALSIIINDSTKAENGGTSLWAQKAYPEGKGIVVGAAEARDHYRKLRGFVPA